MTTEKKSVPRLVEIQHARGEETEFYPTTQEIVDSVARWISRNGEITTSILDIGCGNGSFFEKLDKTDYFCNDDYRHKNHGLKLHQNYKKYGIEKSNILAEQLPEDVILLGSDFHSNTLIDKKVDCIFCNPPYSEYEDWTERIITEGNAEKIVLVIPSRWKDSERIKQALERREYSADIIGTFDFSNAERKARAKVDVIGILPKMSGYGRTKLTDPFDLWFDSTFSLNADKRNESECERNEKKRNEIFKSGDTAEDLVKFYNADMEKLYENYRSLEKLDADIFKELKVDVAMLKKSLRERLKNLKILYWDLLFKKYDKLTQRLTTKGRDRVIKRLSDNTAIDFTLDNIYQLTLWMIKHSNTLFDEQLTDFFFTLSRPENIHRYKSNLRWNDSDWKYLKEKIADNWSGYREDVAKEKLKNVMLDYRIIVTGWKNFETEWKSRLSDSTRDFLYDVCVIGRNLGYDLDFEIPNPYENIDLNQWCNFDIRTKDGKVFCNVKLYKNGNRHLKFCTDFMKKLNVEMARINGWIHSKEEAKEEFGLSETEINQYWNYNLKIGIGEGRNLLGLPDAMGA
ncbi:MAG: DUF4942 domain-containing protein [Treponema sp.]|nr:DUF4942 domain-containing protein [Treponema sp.]